MLKTITKMIKDRYKMAAGLSTLAVILVMLGATLTAQGLGIVAKERLLKIIFKD